MQSLDGLYSGRYEFLRSRSVVPTMEDFDPALFMTVLHATASFSDIRNGLESLNGAKANQVRAPCHPFANGRLKYPYC